MSRTFAKRSSMFLMELIIGILFFSLASGVCVRIFVASRNKSEKAANLNAAVIICQSATDIMYYNEGKDETLNTLEKSYPNLERNPNGAYVFFDADWKPCEKNQAAFILRVQHLIDGKMLYANTTVSQTETGENIYSLGLSKYMPAKT